MNKVSIVRNSAIFSSLLFSGFMVAGFEESDFSDQNQTNLLFGDFDYNPQVFQLEVKNQFDCDGGGSASCGYHALKNGLFIALGLQNGKSSSDIKKDLNLIDPIKKLFGGLDSRWREFIIELRRKKLAAHYIEDQILRNIKKANCVNTNQGIGYFRKLNLSSEYINILQNDDEKNLLCNSLIDIANELVKKGKDNKYLIDFEEILKEIHAQFSKKRELATEDFYFKLYDNLSSKELIAKHLNSFNLDFSISKNNQIITNNKKALGKIESFSGEWLLSSEIEQLVKFEKNNNSLLGKYKLPIFCIDDINSDELLKYLKDNNSEPIIIFIVHVDGNHWVTCVFSKKENEIVFYLSNSSLNQDIRSNEKIKRLISLFDNKVLDKEINERFEENNNEKSNLKNGKSEESDLEKVSKKNNCESKAEKEEVEIKLGLGDLDQNDTKNNFKLISPKIKFENLIQESNPEIELLKDQLSIIKELIDISCPTDLILLYGPPGTGKNCTSEAIASFLGYKYLFISCPRLITSYQGSGVQNIAKIFNFVNSLNEPTVLYFDEIDAFSGSDSQSNSNGEAMRAILELQIQLTNKKSNIICVCATNHPEKLTDSIKDRFQEKIEIGLPGFQAKVKFIKSILNNIPNLKTKDLNILAYEAGKNLDDLSYRELKKIISKALSLSKKRDSQLNISDFKTAVSLIKENTVLTRQQRILLIKKYFSSCNLIDNEIDKIMEKTVNFTKIEIQNLYKKAEKLAGKFHCGRVNFWDIFVAIFRNKNVRYFEDMVLIIKYFLSYDLQISEFFINDLANECHLNCFNSEEVESFIKNAIDYQVTKKKRSLDPLCLYIGLAQELEKKEKNYILTKIVNRTSTYTSGANISLSGSIGGNIASEKEIALPVNLTCGASIPVNNNWIDKPNESYEVQELPDNSPLVLNNGVGYNERTSVIDKRTKALPGYELRCFFIFDLFLLKDAFCPWPYVWELGKLFKYLSLYSIKEIIDKSRITFNVQKNRNIILLQDIINKARELNLNLANYQDFHRVLNNYNLNYMIGSNNENNNLRINNNSEVSQIINTSSVKKNEEKKENMLDFAKEVSKTIVKGAALDIVSQIAPIGFGLKLTYSAFSDYFSK